MILKRRRKLAVAPVPADNQSWPHSKAGTGPQEAGMWAVGKTEEGHFPSFFWFHVQLC